MRNTLEANMFHPMKISDGSMKKLNLYTVTPMPKLETYAQRQKSVKTRNIPYERISKVSHDLVPKFETVRIGSKSMTRNIKGH